MDSINDKQKFHSTSVLGITVNNAELGRQIARMRYDQIGEVLRGMSLEFSRQSADDLSRGRPQLAKLLKETERLFGQLNDLVGRIFRLSRPYMEHEFSEQEKDQSVPEVLVK